MRRQTMKLYIGRDRIYTSHWEPSRRPRLRRVLERVLQITVLIIMLVVGGMAIWLASTDTDTLRLMLIVAGLLAVGAMAKGMKH
jgi:hypothetical protein